MTPPARPIRFYRHPLSGHCHRVELLLAMLKLPFETIDLDFTKKEQKAPGFVAKNNPFGQVPVIEDGEVTLADSNAILIYLATRYDPSGSWLPRDPVAAARVHQWLSVAAGPLAHGPAAARRFTVLGTKLDYEGAKTMAAELFTVLDGYLAQRHFLTGDSPTIADLAIYTYTALAPEGGVSLEPYGHIRAWLARVEALPHFVPMRRTPPRPTA
ncbi:glutathione S-transferase family protein [Hyalangium versicolor]|uniref:glutathione S-transferase family protein n=1 Tax=Hyalangium versicolor TaxID=2861190 RepID=UPI001CCCA7F5|nr:glutathione S-transferase [Hyalangium versicolor]